MSCGDRVQAAGRFMFPAPDRTYEEVPAIEDDSDGECVEQSTEFL